MKRKLLIATAVLLFSYSMSTHAAVIDMDDSERSMMEVIFEQLSPIEEYVENTVIKEVPFDKEMIGTMPHLYPPLELLKPEPITYVVENGDNLYRIALNHGIPLETLMSMNGLTSELIHPGDELVISDEGVEDNLKVPEKKAVTVASTVPKPVQKQPVAKQVAANPPATEGKEMTVTATAYTAYCTGCSGTTATGIDLRSNPNQKVIAVDPSIIPLGTKVWVEGYGEAIAGDVGGAIKGNKIDVFIPSYESAMEWGVKKVKIKVLN
ncbi:3D domain-containing protein [Sporosarcina saromensis]|uniref:3D domain-containing protein n=1 Tax=Sporosarcina saromensis TaxID=359365 RepID=A0ABU4GCB7_9BACL|nr:3D domain-containing protein [Sporosarcina saromensis]MDW0114634.1 3D domain-containing protein [Sporosarcina saromensis]